MVEKKASGQQPMLTDLYMRVICLAIHTGSTQGEVHVVWLTVAQN